VQSCVHDMGGTGLASAGYLLNSVPTDVLGQVTTTTTAAEAWAVLEDMFLWQSRARVTNLRLQLATLKKGTMATSVYFNKMKGLGDCNTLGVNLVH
jgi:hypothetical protein